MNNIPYGLLQIAQNWAGTVSRKPSLELLSNEQKIAFEAGWLT